MYVSMAFTDFVLIPALTNDNSWRVVFPPEDNVKRWRYNVELALEQYKRLNVDLGKSMAFERDTLSAC